MELAKGFLPSMWAHKEAAGAPLTRSLRQPLTQGRRHPVVIVTEALSAQRPTRPENTDLNNFPYAHLSTFKTVYREGKKMKPRSFL